MDIQHCGLGSAEAWLPPNPPLPPGPPLSKDDYNIEYFAGHCNKILLALLCCNYLIDNLGIHLARPLLSYISIYFLWVTLQCSVH